MDCTTRYNGSTPVFGFKPIREFELKMQHDTQLRCFKVGLIYFVQTGTMSHGGTRPKRAKIPKADNEAEVEADTDPGPASQVDFSSMVYSQHVPIATVDTDAYGGGQGAGDNSPAVVELRVNSVTPRKFFSHITPKYAQASPNGEHLPDSAKTYVREHWPNFDPENRWQHFITSGRSCTEKPKVEMFCQCLLSRPCNREELAQWVRENGPCFGIRCGAIMRDLAATELPCGDINCSLCMRACFKRVCPHCHEMTSSKQTAQTCARCHQHIQPKRQIKRLNSIKGDDAKSKAKRAAQLQRKIKDLIALGSAMNIPLQITYLGADDSTPRQGKRSFCSDKKQNQALLYRGMELPHPMYTGFEPPSMLNEQLLAHHLMTRGQHDGQGHPMQASQAGQGPDQGAQGQHDQSQLMQPSVSAASQQGAQSVAIGDLASVAAQHAANQVVGEVQTPLPSLPSNMMAGIPASMAPANMGMAGMAVMGADSQAAMAALNMPTKMPAIHVDGEELPILHVLGTNASVGIFNMGISASNNALIPEEQVAVQAFSAGPNDPLLRARFDLLMALQKIHLLCGPHATVRRHQSVTRTGRQQPVLDPLWKTQ
ncbi:uncharacterized protein MONBRDRAFT_26979 [Monosiga brevicollis MX1]|uniref:Uncharacterized protein n=1 Tax=Monosiga brevicollis TaxID=81824 RepID=A9V3H6_MONBE|nr:uncharacterized protein MONBRDRAFT_26979 [Monosiga brevicollis MX1]EDQ87815.1 predicted protein [Monosiga brevicollis MX1]|eukprot:XP_001747348.1 hypothetical protein [Monosiga brevicollis MX1]